jgi:hypothetical protein
MHLGMTWMGVEFFGLNLGGESRTILQDLPKKPAIDWPAHKNAAAPPVGTHTITTRLPGAQARFARAHQVGDRHGAGR